jgi:protein-disulfide isomerase
MSRNTKISIALVSAFAAVIAVIAIVSAVSSNDQPKPSATASTAATGATSEDASEDAAAPEGTSRVVASDPRRLGARGNTGVTFTEFLDFECEACGAAYPAIEDLRKEFAGQVTFQIRYFPIDGHANARPAAHAVEAAARQGKLEEMYKKMYETQKSWAEQQTSQAAVFRGFAKDLNLNMKEYDSDVDDPKVAARVERDFQAGRALGVASTPTFFVNEEMFQGQSIDDLKQQLQDAIAAS